MKLEARSQQKPRTFVPDSNPKWTVGSVTDATPEDQFERLRVLMFANEQKIEELASQFGTATHRQAFGQWAKLWESLNKQAKVVSN